MSARALYQRFRGRVATKVLKVGVRYASRWLTAAGRANIDIPGELAIIGRVSAIEYDAIYDRKKTLARHVFAPGSRPLLAVGTQPGQVFIIGTGYRFTDRGFVDTNSRGESIDYDEKTRRIKKLRP